jgi:hypothetical protein
MTAATFVAGVVGGLLGLAIGWRVANKGARLTVEHWRSRYRDQDKILEATRAELLKAEYTIDILLNRNRENVFRDGYVYDQDFETDREEWGL